MNLAWQLRNKIIKGSVSMKDTNSLLHTPYRCKYHIVIVPKYRRLIIYNKLRKDIIEILVMLINRFKDVELIEGHACPIISICYLKYHQNIPY